MLAWLKQLLPGSVPKSLAQRGEDLAAKYLRRNGLKVLLRNFRCGVGEIDIVARDGDMLVFVEVKTRAEDLVTPESQVNLRKQHQITKAATVYLSRYGTQRPPARFDVVAIVWPEGGEPIVRHTPHAFEAT